MRSISLGDAANYAISLGVAGMALTWRARAALLKGISLLALALVGDRYHGLIMSGPALFRKPRSWG